MACIVTLICSSCLKQKNKECNYTAPSGDGIIENAVTDVDGNKYRAVKLGDQVWMAENLRTTKYADGKSIVLGTTFSPTFAYRYYPDFNSENAPTYGYLYNWPAVMRDSASSDSNPSKVQGICPDGWHVPSNSEWTQLTEYVNSQRYYACVKFSLAPSLASVTGWNSSENENTPGNNSYANNSTGFSAFPAGHYRGYYGGFGDYAYFWSSTDNNGDNAYSWYLYTNGAIVFMHDFRKSDSFSVRCVKDSF